MSERRITISGPGPVGVIQQAVSAGKTAIWVVDQHPFGYVLRIGYYLHPTNSDPPPVTWFSRDEVTITFDRSEEPHFRSAKLEVNFKHPKAHERHALD